MYYFGTFTAGGVFFIERQPGQTDQRWMPDEYRAFIGMMIGDHHDSYKW